MSRLINMLEKLVFFVAGLVLVFIAHFSRAHAAPMDIDEQAGAYAQLIQVIQPDSGDHS